MRSRRKKKAGGNDVGTETVAHHDPTVRAEEAAHTRRLSRLGIAFALVWLLFLVFPIVWLYEARDDPARLLPATAGLALFVVVYVWAASRAVRAIAGAGESLGLRTRWAALAVLTAISLVLPLAYGGNWVGPLGFVAFLAGLTLSFRAVVAVSLAVALLSAVTASAMSPGWGPTVSITINSTLAGPGAFLVRWLVVTNRELREARREIARLAVSEERLRLSREIHDTLTQGFTSIVMHLAPARKALRLYPDTTGRQANGRQAEWHLDQIDRTARESLEEARRLVWALRPEALQDAPLPEAMERLTERFSEESGVLAEASVTGTPGPLAPEVEVTLLRAAQEALSNVRKHAGASLGRVGLTLSYLEDAVALDVRDDGVGFDQARARSRKSGSGGLGLAGMRERIEGLGGTLSVESSPGEGTTLAVELPVAADDQLRE